MHSELTTAPWTDDIPLNRAHLQIFCVRRILPSDLSQVGSYSRSRNVKGLEDCDGTRDSE